MIYAVGRKKAERSLIGHLLYGTFCARLKTSSNPADRKTALSKANSRFSPPTIGKLRATICIINLVRKSVGRFQWKQAREREFAIVIIHTE